MSNSEKVQNDSELLQSSKKITMTMGMKVKMSKCHEHMTIAALTEDVTNNPNFLIHLDHIPRYGIIAGTVNVGRDNNIPVWAIRFKSNDDESAVSLNKIFHLFNQHEEGNAMTRIFFPHITKKKESELKEGDIIEFDHLFVKKLGPHDPFFIHKPPRFSY